MSSENEGIVIDVTAPAHSNAGYWCVVKVDLEDVKEFKNDELFETREEADASCEKCQQKWKEHAWDNREYLSMEYQVRFVSIEESLRKNVKNWKSGINMFVRPLWTRLFQQHSRLVARDL